MAIKASVTSLILIGLGLLLLTPVSAAGNPVYTLAISPNVPVSRGTTMTFTLSISNGQKNIAYGVSVGVEKPNGTGISFTTRIIPTDNRGIGSTNILYPDPSFTSINGTVATDVGGVYFVSVNETSPSSTPNVASSQFTVTSQLTVVLSEPVTGIYLQRGNVVTISVTVTDLSGPISTATVSAKTPGGGKVFLAQTTNGVYSYNYQSLMYDPLGAWSIQVTAVDINGNSGQSSPAIVNVTKSVLVIDSLTAYNSKGLPATDFSPGDTVYPFFRMRYSNGVFITTGQYQVTAYDPQGHFVASLSAIYDSSRFGFYTPTGYKISNRDPSGAWTFSIDSGSANDGFGNTGPTFTTSVRVQIVVEISLWSFLPIVLAGMIAIVSGSVIFKRFGKSLAGFDYLEKAIGGDIPRGSSVLLLGEPGTGKTILAYQLMFDELEGGSQCGLLSYDAFPEDVGARMKEFGWDITSHLRKGRLKIIDCYSGLAGDGEGAIRDPSDLTGLNIQVSSIIGRAKHKPVTLLLDSVTPIFNGIETKQAIIFLQTVAAKIKKTGGVFYLTGTSGAIPAESLVKLKSVADGVIELTLDREHRHAHRFLRIVKMERRKTISDPIPFEIDRRHGIMFRVSRIKEVFARQANPTVAKKNQRSLYTEFIGKIRSAIAKFWKSASSRARKGQGEEARKASLEKYTRIIEARDAENSEDSSTEKNLGKNGQAYSSIFLEDDLEDSPRRGSAVD